MNGCWHVFNPQLTQLLPFTSERGREPGSDQVLTELFEFPPITGNWALFSCLDVDSGAI